MSSGLNRVLINFCRSNLVSRVLIKQPRNVQFQRFQSEKPVNPNEAEKPPQTGRLSKTRSFGPITWKSFGIISALSAVGLLFTYYVKNEKEQAMLRERKRQLGKAAIGGRFELVNSKGEVVKSEDYAGKWLLIYFGFTHCPDICPDELEKMSSVVDQLGKDPHNMDIVPIFITVDPIRDTKEVVDKYVKEFSPKLIGLTGTVDQIKSVCKAFRVYYSEGPKDYEQDYIVDHTIIMYLVDPNGEFVDYYGQTKDNNQIVSSILINIEKWKQLNKKSWFG